MPYPSPRQHLRCLLLAALLLLPAGTGAAMPGDELLNGAEMVGKVTDTEAEIRLVAGPANTPGTEFRLVYGVTSQEDPEGYTHETDPVSGFAEHDPISFRLDSLFPATRYYYRVAVDEGEGWQYRDEFSFMTRRRKGSSFRICIVADAHISPFGTHPRSYTVEKNVAEDAPDIVVSVGDMYFFGYQGGNSFPFWKSRESALDNWSAVRRVLDLSAHSSTQVHVIGNHDGESAWDRDLPQFAYCREGRMAYLPVPDESTYPEGGDRYGRYGAMTWGDALLIWLDNFGFCEVDPGVMDDSSYYVLGEEQRDFLERTLADSTARWKFIFAHHVFGGDDSQQWAIGYGRGGNKVAHLHDQAFVQELMVRYGVDAFFYGHDHVFSVGMADGIPYICAGHTSSCPWKVDLESLYAPVAIESTAGHVRIDVSPERVEISYVKASTNPKQNGTILASHTIRASTDWGDDTSADGDAAGGGCGCAVLGGAVDASPLPELAAGVLYLLPVGFVLFLRRRYRR